MHIQQNSIMRFVYETSTIDEVHPSGVAINLDIGLHRNSAWMGAPFMPAGIVGVDENSDIQSECVCYTCSYAVVISQGARTKPLNFF
jgi:hypothetical protein